MQITNSLEEDFAVILIEVFSQGVFDLGMTLYDCKSLFALSVLISSVQILNVMARIRTDDLGNAEVFTYFSQRIPESSQGAPKDSRPPFQDMIFLVRDWSHPDANDYGREGGQAYLEA